MICPSLDCTPASASRVWANPNAPIKIEQTESSILISYELFDLRREIPLGNASPLVTYAHHSTNANFTQEIIAVEGVIERVRFQNPHASVLIKHTDESGKETFWLIESGARTTLERQGVSLDRLLVGSKIKATGRKGRREFTMYLREITFEDGSVFIPQPDLN